ncbi:MAG: hypothetical protein ACRD19_15070 [Terriglobia bacterium]
METSVQSSAVQRRNASDSCRRVPTFDADGERIRDYSEARIRDLVAAGRMVALPNRRGKILFAQLVRRDPPTWRPASHAKNKPVFFDPELPGRAACAALFDVPLDMTRRELAAYQRAIFQQVLLSTMTPDPRPSARVVAIDSYRPNRRRQAKPERLAA